jgi:hypothetical protein
VEKKGGVLPIGYFEKYINIIGDTNETNETNGTYELDLEEIFQTFTQKF